MSKDTVVKLIQPGTFSDQLTDILRDGARALLAQAVEAEVAGFLSKHADLKTEDDLHQARDPSVASGLVVAHSDLITAWTKRIQNDNPAASLENETLEDLLNAFIPKHGEWMSDKDLTVIQKFKAEIVRLNDDCEKTGGYTTEASTYYDRYAGDHNVDKAEQLRNEALQ